MGYFNQAETRFKAIGGIAHKTWPQLAPRDQFTQVRHHLATVTYPQSQRLRTMEEGCKLIAYTVIEQDRLRPTFTGTQHITVGETSARDQGVKILQSRASSQQVTHMHVDSIEARTVESCRHFNMRVHALLTQHGNFRTCASGNIRCCHIFVDIERQFHIQARIGVV